MSNPQLTNHTNEQELREQFVDAMWNYFGIEDKSELDHFRTIFDYVVTPFVTAYTNAEIARTLDRLEIEMPSKRNTLVGDAYQRTFCNEYNKALKEVSKAIQDERAKLKGIE